MMGSCVALKSFPLLIVALDHLEDTDNAIPVTQGQKRLAIILISSAEGKLAGFPLDILAE